MALMRSVEEYGLEAHDPRYCQVQQSLSLLNVYGCCWNGHNSTTLINKCC